MHQSFVTMAPHHPQGNSWDSDFAILKALHCGDKLKAIASLFGSLFPYAVAIITPFFKETTTPALL